MINERNRNGRKVATLCRYHIFIQKASHQTFALGTVTILYKVYIKVKVTSIVHAEIGMMYCIYLCTTLQCIASVLSPMGDLE